MVFLEVFGEIALCAADQRLAQRLADAPALRVGKEA
jgi:hypothetical protein